MTLLPRGPDERLQAPKMVPALRLRRKTGLLEGYGHRTHPMVRVAQRPVAPDAVLAFAAKNYPDVVSNDERGTCCRALASPVIHLVL